MGYCTVDDVKQRMTGDQPAMSGAFDGVLASAIDEVSDMIDAEVRNLRGQGEGWTFLAGTPTVSRYTGRDAQLLLIDDSTEVTAVALLDDIGNLVQTLVLGTGYLLWPMNSLPITGLRRIGGRWPTTYGGVQVGRTPGYCTSLPLNIVDGTIKEVIRSYRGGQAGEDDRLGTTPYGTVIVSKALLQSTLRILNRYRYGGGMLRGPG
jgi:hypothetical protein